MKIADEATTISGVISAPGRGEYRFEFVRRNKSEDLFLFRRNEAWKMVPERDDRGRFQPGCQNEWILMPSRQGRAERDYLWKLYHRTSNVMADDVDEDMED